jgi:hypothetical protein
MGIPADFMAVLRARHTSDRCNPIVIIAHEGLGVCDGVHSGFVMKKVME